ncbi:MAG: MotA/TolQ/ExbB proton channel family protein [Pirellulales bacterium]|nr:MotA/TolQ/ExbB proton channel family protein [Pirellulales bacterium]
MPDTTVIVTYASYACYLALAAVALWGAFCTIMVWRRVALIRFRGEDEQTDFLNKFDEHVAANDLEGAEQLCKEDPRAVPQLAALAIANRKLGYAKIRSLLVDRFQRDVLADLEHRLSWVYTMIKSAPMMGLFGTVLGMIGAFGQLATSDKVTPTALAGDIQVALNTTALGLAIAIPLIICTNSINVRIRKLEELVGYGLARVLEDFKQLSHAAPPESKKQVQTAAAGRN